MTTQHSQITKALADLLKQEPPIAGGRVFVGRMRPIGADKPDAVVVRLARSASHDGAVLGARTSWSTLIEIDCYGRGTADDPDAGADMVVEQVAARLDGNSSLGGLAMDIAPLAGNTLEWDRDQLETSMTSITARFVVKHQTTGRTLTL